MTQPTTVQFEKLDVLQLRRKLGSVVKDVQKNNKRFEVFRRGEAVGLFIPISDKTQLESILREEAIKRTATAIEGMTGIINDTSISDASTTVDEYAYGNLSQDE